MTATPPRRLTHRLSAAFVRTAEPGFYGDGHGLNVRVDPSGARQWVQRLVIRGRPRMLGLGGYPLVSLAEAHTAAFEPPASPGGRRPAGREAPRPGRAHGRGGRRRGVGGRCCIKTLRGGALLVTLGRSHTTGMKSKVHPTYKTKYRVANWPAYNQTLVRRGDVTVWVSSEAIAAWTPRRSGRRGGQRRYSDLAIETALTLRLVYHLPLRQAEGFLYTLFGMMRLDLSAPDYTTLSRRSQHVPRRLRLVLTDEGIHLVLDSTGLSIVGAGEWAAATHGGRGRRKLHRGVDQSGVIRVHTLTEATGDDATTGLDLLTAVKGPLVRVTADVASDTVAVYETATARGATVIIPPAKTANISGHGPRSPARDRTITWVKQLGRRRWKKASGYHRQGRVENAFFRDTSIIGDGLRARSPAGQGSEAVLGCEILNRMTALGRPVSYRIGR